MVRPTIFKTETDGWVTQEFLYKQFIQSMMLMREYKLFEQAIVEERITIL